jgi:hypothetical protein
MSLMSKALSIKWRRDIGLAPLYCHGRQRGFTACRELHRCTVGPVTLHMANVAGPRRAAVGGSRGHSCRSYSVSR